MEKEHRRHCLENIAKLMLEIIVIGKHKGVLLNPFRRPILFLYGISGVFLFGAERNSSYFIFKLNILYGLFENEALL